MTYHAPATKTPIVMIIYKRPETTQRVFDAIRQARPRQLFVVADGPRTPEDTPHCDAARAIIETVDWDCDVLTDYASTNLGLQRRVVSGLDWVFDQVEEAIILEDDCLPDHSFFRFCDDLLAYYRDEPRVMHIGGSNFLRELVPIHDSYYFSRYPHIWGWATWRRAWQFFDVAIPLWQEDTDERYLEQFQIPYERNFWRYVWNRVIAGKSSAWSYQWIFACIAHQGLSICPVQNLVSNIGVSPTATHTRKKRIIHDMTSHSMTFPLKHPDALIRNEKADVVAVHEALLNARSGKRMWDALRLLIKRILWARVR